LGRKMEMIVALAEAGLSNKEIVERVHSTSSSVRAVCSQARAAGRRVPFESERREMLRGGVIVSLSEEQILQILRGTGMAPQEFVDAAIAALAPDVFARRSDHVASPRRARRTHDEDGVDIRASCQGK
jgi:hypothetical protein